MPANRQREPEGGVPQLSTVYVTVGLIVPSRPLHLVFTVIASILMNLSDRNVDVIGSEAAFPPAEWQHACPGTSLTFKGLGVFFHLLQMTWVFLLSGSCHLPLRPIPFLFSSLNKSPGHTCWSTKNVPLATSKTTPSKRTFCSDRNILYLHLTRQ